MKTTQILAALFLGMALFWACGEDDPRLGEVVRIERRNTRTCNFFVRPLDGGSEVTVQNGCDHHSIGDIIEIP